MTQLPEILTYLENNLDAKHLEKVRLRWLNALAFGRQDRPPLRVTYPGQRFQPYSMAENFADPEKMLVSQLCGLCAAVDLQDDTLPMIRANYGVGILPSLFGAGQRIIDNQMPWSEPLGGIGAIRRMIGRGIPDINAGLGEQVLATQAYYTSQLAAYPKCRSLVRLYHPDLQGPFDVAHLLWGTEIYYALYDEPELVHDLLRLVTATYIRFLKAAKSLIQDEDEGQVYQWGCLYRGRVVLRNDTAVNLSRELYETFVRPYDQAVLDEFGSGSIHYCGRAEQWIFQMMECRNLKAMNFGQPPGMPFGLEFLGKIRPEAVSRQIAIVDYHLPPDLLPQVIAEGIYTGITLNTHAGSLEEARQILRRFQSGWPPAVQASRPRFPAFCTS